MTYGHLQADCLYTGISSGPNARCRVWEAFSFTFYLRPVLAGVYRNVTFPVSDQVPITSHYRCSVCTELYRTVSLSLPGEWQVKSNMRRFGRCPSAVSTDKRLLLLTQWPTLDDTVSLARLACTSHGLRRWRRSVIVDRWRFGVAVTALGASTKLRYIEPG